MSFAEQSSFLSTLNLFLSCLCSPFENLSYIFLVISSTNNTIIIPYFEWRKLQENITKIFQKDSTDKKETDLVLISN